MNGYLAPDIARCCSKGMAALADSLTLWRKLFRAVEPNEERDTLHRLAAHCKAYTIVPQSSDLRLPFLRVVAREQSDSGTTPFGWYGGPGDDGEKVYSLPVTESAIVNVYAESAHAVRALCLAVRAAVISNVLRMVQTYGYDGAYYGGTSEPQPDHEYFAEQGGAWKAAVTWRFSGNAEIPHIAEAVITPGTTYVNDTDASFTDSDNVVTGGADPTSEE